jgi:multimeric flavodoxin WrbA
LVVIGIVGSPRKNGLTSRLVDATLEGSRSREVETQKVYLVDYDVKQFRGTGGSIEANKYCPEELSRLCEEAHAIVLGAPVYWGDINGLTKDFMDTVRISNSRGKPAVGIAIAGGSGKGLLSGVQSIYHFFFHKQMKGIDPMPVSRFNLEESIETLRTSGAKLADLSKSQKFEERSDEYWTEVSTDYAALKYLKCDHVDEFVMLSEQLIQALKGKRVENAEKELNKARALIAEGKRDEGVVHAVRSYQMLYYGP